MAKGTIKMDDGDAELEAGFEEEVVEKPTAEKPTAEKPTAEKPTEESGEPPAAEGAPSPAAAQAADPDDAPVTISRRELQRLSSAADRVLANETKLQSVFGTLGTLRETVGNLQKRSSSRKIKLSDTDFKELTEQFPEIGEYTKKGLQAMFDQIADAVVDEPAPGAEAAAAAAAASEAEAERRKSAEKAARDAVVKREIEILADIHPEWRKLTGIGDDGKVDQTSSYRIWLAKQSKDYQDRVNNSDNGNVIARSIDLFIGAQSKAAADKVIEQNNARLETRRARLRDAVQPRGDGAAAPSGRTDDDEFESGFKTG